LIRFLSTGYFHLWYRYIKKITSADRSQLQVYKGTRMTGSPLLSAIINQNSDRSHLTISEN
jgi:hypothetical protein